MIINLAAVHQNEKREILLRREVGAHRRTRYDLPHFTRVPPVPEFPTDDEWNSFSDGHGVEYVPLQYDQPLGELAVAGVGYVTFFEVDLENRQGLYYAPEGAWRYVDLRPRVSKVLSCIALGPYAESLQWGLRNGAIDLPERFEV